MRIVVESPIIARLYDTTPEEIEELKKQFSFKNGKIDEQLKRHRKKRWWKVRDPDGYEEHENILLDQLYDNVVKQDKDGYYIRPASISYIKNIEYEVESKIVYPELSPLAWKTEPEFTPYQYQYDSVRELIKLSHGNIEIATGCGKSFILLMLARIIGKSVVVVTPSKSIFRELYTEFQEKLGKGNVGGFGDGLKDIKKPITISIGKSITMLKKGTPEYVFFANKKALLVDECFPFNSRIHTENGNLKIGDIVNEFLKTGKTAKVLSFNLETKKYEYKNVTNAWRKPYKDLVEVKCGLIRFRCTFSHKILTKNGWKEAGLLEKGDLIVSKYGEAKSNFTCLIPNDHVEDLIIGSFLGDGSVSYSKVTSVGDHNKNPKNNEFLYDIEVEDNHNFIVGRGENGVVAHNCHTWGSETLEEVCHGVLSNAPRRFFMSATNTRGDGTIKLLQSIVGKTVLSIGIKEAIENKFLCPLKFYVKKLHSPNVLNILDPIECKRKHFLYNDEIAKFYAQIANAMWTVNQESTLILVEELVQIKMLLKYLKVPYSYIHSASKKEAAEWGLEKVDLTAELERFNKGEVRVLIGTRSVSTGTNIYPTHNTCNWMGGSSEIITKQGTMGRSTRWMKPKYAKFHREKTHSKIWDVSIINQKNKILENMLKKRIFFYSETGEDVNEVG